MGACLLPWGDWKQRNHCHLFPKWSFISRELLGNCQISCLACLGALMRWTKKCNLLTGVAFLEDSRHAINFPSRASGVRSYPGITEWFARPRCSVRVVFCVLWSWCDASRLWCVCGKSSWSLAECACGIGGMGRVFTGRPAGTVGLERGVCLCVPLLKQRGTRQLSPLAARSDFFLTSLPLHTTSQAPVFLCTCSSPCRFLFSHWFPFHYTTNGLTSISQTESVSNWNKWGWYCYGKVQGK